MTAPNEHVADKSGANAAAVKCHASKLHNFVAYFHIDSYQNYTDGKFDHRFSDMDSMDSDRAAVSFVFEMTVNFALQSVKSIRIEVAAAVEVLTFVAWLAVAVAVLMFVVRAVQMQRTAVEVYQYAFADVTPMFALPAMNCHRPQTLEPDSITI